MERLEDGERSVIVSSLSLIAWMKALRFESVRKFLIAKQKCAEFGRMFDLVPEVAMLGTNAIGSSGPK